MNDDRDEALHAMQSAGDTIVTGLERLIPSWSVRATDRILDAWDRLDEAERADARLRISAAGTAAAERVAAEMRTLFALDPADQTVTPLQIARTAVREPTGVLVDLGVAEVDRDPFDERAHPDDRYDLSPRSLGDFGDPELGAELLVWGLANSKILRNTH